MNNWINLPCIDLYFYEKTWKMEKVKSDWLLEGNWINPGNPDTSITRPLPRPFDKEIQFPRWESCRRAKDTFICQNMTRVWVNWSRFFTPIQARLSCKLDPINYVPPTVLLGEPLKHPEIQFLHKCYNTDQEFPSSSWFSTPTGAKVDCFVIKVFRTFSLIAWLSRPSLTLWPEKSEKHMLQNQRNMWCKKQKYTFVLKFCAHGGLTPKLNSICLENIFCFKF